jgi:hypothetical protein
MSELVVLAVVACLCGTVIFLKVYEMKQKAQVSIRYSQIAKEIELLKQDIKKIDKDEIAKLKSKVDALSISKGMGR